MDDKILVLNQAQIRDCVTMNEAALRSNLADQLCANEQAEAAMGN